MSMSNSKMFCEPRGISASGEPLRILRVARSANKIKTISAITVTIKVFVTGSGPMVNTVSEGRLIFGNLP